MSDTSFSVGRQGVFRTPEGHWRQRNPLMRGERVRPAGHCTFLSGSFHQLNAWTPLRPLIGSLHYYPIVNEHVPKQNASIRATV